MAGKMITFEGMRIWFFAACYFTCLTAWTQSVRYPFDSRNRAQIFYQQKDYSNAWSAWEVQDKSEDVFKTKKNPTEFFLLHFDSIRLELRKS